MSNLPTDAKARKDAPIARGVLDYFPNAIAAVAELSRIGNEQHNPGQPMHWAREKSTDHADCIVRHLIDRGTLDTDGVRHSAKVAWRALALLQTEIEKAAQKSEAKSLDPTVLAELDRVSRPAPIAASARCFHDAYLTIHGFDGDYCGGCGALVKPL